MAKKKKKKVSLVDIANALGVSKTLVSMVLNGKGDQNGINEDTQKRVLAKAKELNYKPNRMARSLRMGKSHTIGMIVADISNSFYAKICRAAEDAADKLGYNLMFCSSDERAEKESDLIEMLRDRQCDGLIIATTLNNQEDIKEMIEDNYPFVLIDRQVPSLDTPYVGVDNRKGAYEMVTHLVDSGYKHIGLLTISPSHLSSITERAEGYKDALKDAGIEVDPNLIREIPFDDIYNSMLKEVKDLVKHKTNALFVVNNNLAVACMEVLNELGLKVPHDMAVGTFDDIELFKLCYPPLTAVAQPMEEIGKQAVDLLIRNINGKMDPEKKKLILGTDLIVRRSCGAYLREI